MDDNMLRRPSAERRGDARRPALMLVELRLAGGRNASQETQYPGLMYDVGAEGVCVLCEPPLREEGPEDTRRPSQAVRITVSAGNACPVRLDTRLVHRRGCRLGLRFDGLDTTAQHFIRACLSAPRTGTGHSSVAD